MIRDPLSRTIPLIITLGLILVKLFIGSILLIAVLVFFVIPATKDQSGSIAFNTNPSDTTAKIISPEDAAIANSEWSGVFSQLTAIPPGTQIPLPTRMPTILPVEDTAASNSNNTQARPANSNLSLIGSPLEGFQVSDLKELVSQDFLAPPPGEDSGHHGVDFAFWNRGNKPILGDPIMAVFAGKVVMANPKEVPPYGYDVMIETPLSEIPTSLVQSINMPIQPIGTMANNKLNCPDLSHDQWQSTSKSLYTLYAHLLDPTLVKPDDQVVIGQTIGYVGNSGYSSAPHLHLEMRIGPSGASFSNMGHYDPITTEEDRHNYCNWRVSGVFQMFDPMELFDASLALK